MLSAKVCTAESAAATVFAFVGTELGCIPGPAGELNGRQIVRNGCRGDLIGAQGLTDRLADDGVCDPRHPLMSADICRDKPDIVGSAVVHSF
jgi:hypothetical protein